MTGDVNRATCPEGRWKQESWWQKCTRRRGHRGTHRDSAGERWSAWKLPKIKKGKA